MKATNTEPSSSSSKVVTSSPVASARDGAGQDRTEHPDDHRAETASLGRSDGPAGQTAREEPHHAPAEDPHAAETLLGRLAGLGG